MTGRVVLAVTLRAGNAIRAGHRFDVTEPTEMPSGDLGVRRTWRRYTLQRRDGESVQVTVTADGMPYGSWQANHDWPYESADAIARARNDLREGAPA